MPAVVIFVAAKIPVMIVVAAVVMLDTTSIPRPVTREEPLPVMVWCYPVSSLVGRPSPVTCVPFVVMAHRVPITRHPRKLWSGLGWRLNVSRRRRWSADCDSN